MIWYKLLCSFIAEILEVVKYSVFNMQSQGVGWCDMTDKSNSTDRMTKSNLITVQRTYFHLVTVQ